MKNLFFLGIFVFLFQVSFATDNDWGKTGHRTTGEIAEEHLSRRAKRKIEKILDGHSLAFVSTFGDEIKSDPDYRKYSPWHYVNLKPNQTSYSEETANPAGDLVLGIKKSISVLKDEDSTREEKEFYLKMLVHFMGDLHQPLHAGHESDRGGNDIQVRWFGEDSNLHRVWDSEMINSYLMSYTELAANGNELSKRQVKAIEQGSILDWMYESKVLSEEIYNSVEGGERLGYDYMYVWFPVVRQQLQKGGIRLAKVLNEIFG
ncbi:MAG TPA: S1/P1 nuclease [Salinimicrobium sp.]|nr:S1/P1 nuclease [Salinimicrobium sp.]